jgi:membrane carboxypeptidase/penicillin-binding protein
VPTARVALEVGIPQVARVARELGIQSRLDPVPSLSLGTSEVTLLEITGAYAALAAGGTARAPTLIRAIMAPSGEAIPLHPLRDPPGVGADEAYLVTNLLRGVIDSGTGRNARSLGVRGDVAGKTGTTDDFRDAWFVGYTPARAIGVWVGFDREDAVGLTGAAAALPIWASAMRDSEGANGDGTFTRPRGVVSVVIDPETGLLATQDCPDSREEEFIRGTEPTEECDRHGPGLIDRLGRLFGF